MLLKENKYWAIFSVVLIFASLFLAAKYLKDAEMFIVKAGVSGPLVAILFFGFLAFTPISSDPLTLLSGVLFGPVMGVFVSWMGNNLAALIEYFVGKRIGDVTNFQKVKKKLPFGISKMPVNSPLFLIFGRSIPGYGGKIVSVMAGMYNVPIGIYVWTSILINFIGSLLLSLGGYNLIRFIHW